MAWYNDAMPSAALRPNVLLIAVDRWPALLLGIAGHPTIQTPTLDPLARNGTRYSQAYSLSPMCIPARRSLMTGTTPRTHGDRSCKETLPMPAGIPTRPAFWYLSYCPPHPPMTPLEWYLAMYREVDPGAPVMGDWATDAGALPYLLQARRLQWSLAGEEALWARRALCTHIDHQLRVIIGTLREEGLLDNTIILFTSDHGDMLGDHGLWNIGLFYEMSAKVPMLLMGMAGAARVGHHRTDDRLVCWEDVMPTLLDVAGIPVPGTVEGLSMVGDRRREWLYGEFGEGAQATRMVYDGRHKLIYYAAGNRIQLFDTQADPHERHDLADAPGYADTRARLTQRLVAELDGGDEAWMQDGRLVGLPAQTATPQPNRGLSSQRGAHWPLPPPGYSAG